VEATALIAGHRSEWDLSNAKFSVGFVGYLEPHKGSKLNKPVIPLLLREGIDIWVCVGAHQRNRK
jgi:hypothetical protein